MIEALKDEDLIRRAGGRFRLTTLVQKRWGQLMDGARPMIAREGRTDLELVIEEIRQGKVDLEQLALAEGANLRTTTTTTNKADAAEGSL